MTCFRGKKDFGTIGSESFLGLSVWCSGCVFRVIPAPMRWRDFLMTKQTGKTCLSPECMARNPLLPEWDCFSPVFSEFYQGKCHVSWASFFSLSLWWEKRKRFSCCKRNEKFNSSSCTFPAKTARLSASAFVATYFGGSAVSQMGTMLGHSVSETNSNALSNTCN